MSPRRFLALSAALAGVFAGASIGVAQTAPPLPKAVLSGNLPHVVPPIPSGLTPEQARPYFDIFSWQSFLALNWPAVAGKRGVAIGPNDPNAFKAAFRPNPTGNYPTVVWGTWKQAYELF